ncbi:15891_t:CDS:2 [Cetraspora pellucida]|uniref:15891_t:CDS:1 n=1 Tax=Cetraspora pellucida TaxID=1433469 RepID=A0ACA9KLE4_9GLOM|nr:15891_t:CDS:2 [Cetraspora pellucida]
MDINKFDTSSSVKTTQLNSINAIKDTFDTSFPARNNNILSQPELIVLSDMDDELPINLQIIENENPSNWKDDDILSDNLLNNNTIVENSEDKVESQITFAKFGQNLTVDQVDYYLEFQEYPKTSLTGVASIYNVSGWKPEEAKKVFGLSNIQYAYGNPENIRSIQICPFLEVPVQKTYHSCYSIKICEFSSATLNIKHISVNFED